MSFVWINATGNALLEFRQFIYFERYFPKRLYQFTFLVRMIVQKFLFFYLLTTHIVYQEKVFKGFYTHAFEYEGVLTSTNSF